MTMVNRKGLFTLLAALLAVLLLATAVPAAEKHKGYARGEAFITAQELNKLIEAKDPKLVVIAVASKPQYLSGHIPGAINVWRPDYEADPKTTGGISGNLIDAAGFTKTMQAIGVDADSKVVVYDHKYDATRLWWAFFYFGKTDVRVLDGGIKAWTQAGFSTAMLPSGKVERPGTWVAKVTYPKMRADTNEVLSLKDNANAQLWDVRANDEVCGEKVMKGANRGGRIPWSVQADWTNVKTKSNDAEWVTGEEAKNFFASKGFDATKQQYAHCQSGVRSTQIIFTLYAMGWPVEKLTNYDDSWIGWANSEKLPIEMGCPDGSPAPWMKRMAEGWLFAYDTK